MLPKAFKRGEKKNGLLMGGLCNRIICLATLVEYSKLHGYAIDEPVFHSMLRKPKEPKHLKFSDIYDLEYFNEQMKNKGIQMITNDNRDYQRVPIDINLWIKKRSLSTMYDVLLSLKLKPEYLKIVEEINTSNNVSIHIRNELGWGPGYPTIINKIKEKYSDENKLFFTTGQNHDYISNLLNENNVSSFYYYNSSLSYEVNSAINFELCVNSDIFIGMSRSSFSHLIIMKRFYLNKNNKNSFYDMQFDYKQIERLFLKGTPLSKI